MVGIIVKDRQSNKTESQRYSQYITNEMKKSRQERIDKTVRNTERAVAIGLNALSGKKVSQGEADYIMSKIAKENGL
jgi:hypothetical protein